MTGYKPIVTGGFTLPTIEREPSDHICGRCRTPFGVQNPACPNRPKTEPAPATPVDGFFTDEEAAAILESWSQA